MKLSARDANAYFARPDPTRAGLLLFGEDAMRVALKRQQVISALIGPQGEAEMRLTRIAASDLRKDAALLLDAVKAQGFFAGPRAVLLEDAGDGLALTIEAALTEWRDGDAHIVVTAGALAAKSKLRKLFSDHANAYAAGIYNDPMGRAEIEAELNRAGLRDVDRSAMEVLQSLAKDLPPGDFRQTLEKVALYKHGDTSQLTVEDVEVNAPQSTEAGVDDVLDCVAEGRLSDIGPLMTKLQAQGVAAVTLIIMATRHFRALHSANCDAGGAATGIGKLRPPVIWSRRDRMVRQAQNWGGAGLEHALELIMDSDLQLRSAGQTAPQLALVERLFIRLAMLAQRSAAGR